jgi:tRNA-splicing ligase RtcB (3'-phosphate/5'-hydroxy nucleic acid ligase)
MNAWKNDGMKVPVKSWSPDAEQGAIDQIEMAARLPFVFSHIAMMADAHSGYGVPIGSVVATKGVIVPFFVGVDIGCGMSAVKTSLTAIDGHALMGVMGDIRAAVPVGFNHHKEPRTWEGFDRAPDIQIIQAELQSARRQLGTLGGGNHFIEIQKGDDDHIWIMLHSGSRNFGLKTANAYHEKAKALCERWYSDIPHKDLSFLPMDDPAGQEYFAAMKYCLDFAAANRAEMMERIKAILYSRADASFDEPINIHHNYAVMENHFGTNVMVHRKGATRAYAWQVGIIPGSMGTASYITEGLGNPESFMSSSHGAGRLMGRKEATRTLNLEDEQAKMAGIIHGLRNAADLDEAPGAYKDIDAVMANQADLVKILVKLLPLAVIKG